MSQTTPPSTVRGPAPQPARERVGVLHRQGERWRLIVAERRNGGGVGSAGTLAVIEARTLAGDPWSAVPDAAARHGFERVVVVAPGRSTVARCIQVPIGPAEEMAAAVSLLAEAQLPESLPAHRRAGGLIPDAERPGMRTALLSGWTPDPKAAPIPPTEALDKLRITHTTPIAALAALRGEVGAALYAEPSEGAVSMLAGGDERTFARVLVEETGGGAAFWKAVAQVSGETAAAVGVAAPQIAPGLVGPALRLDPRSITALKLAVHDVPERVEWLNDYGIALGAALLATSPDPLVRPLTGLLESAPVIREPAIARAVNWVAVPKHAWIVAAASVALMLLAPLAFGWARVAVVNMKAGGIADRLKGRDESVRRAAVIGQMEQSRWPMTKLLADVAGATPKGVVVDSMRLATDQGLTINGTAETPDLLNQMQANLSKTRIFANVQITRQESRASGTEFGVKADVTSPYYAATPADDYATQTLAVRLYGPGASNVSTPIGGRSRSNEGGGRPVSRRDRGPRTNGESGDGGGGGGGRRERAERPSEASKPSTPVPTEAPPPLTDEQIRAMDASKARSEMVARRGAAQRGNFDAATKARLGAEADRLRDQALAAQSVAPKGDAPAATGATGSTGAGGSTGTTGGGK